MLKLSVKALMFLWIFSFHLQVVETDNKIPILLCHLLVFNATCCPSESMEGSSAQPTALNVFLLEQTHILPFCNYRIIGHLF